MGCVNGIINSSLALQHNQPILSEKLKTIPSPFLIVVTVVALGALALLIAEIKRWGFPSPTNCVGSIYPRATAGVNVCNYLHLDPVRELAIIFDGAGHGDPRVKIDQFPIYEAIINCYIEEFDRFDFSQADSQRLFNDRTKFLAVRFQNAFSSLIYTYDQKRTLLVKEITSLYTKLKNLLNDPLAEFTKTDFESFRGLIDINHVMTAISKYKDFQDLNDSDRKILNLLEYITTSNYQSFIDLFKTLNLDEHKATEPYLKKVNTPKFAGPAALFAQIIRLQNGVFLLTSQWKNCCYAIIKANGEIDWVKEAHNSIGMKPANTRSTGLHTITELAPGSAVFGFTDGIGQFLSREELSAILYDNILSGTEAVMQAIRAEIAKHPKTEGVWNDEIDVSRKSASNPDKACKKWDPTGNDSQSVDDISFFLLFEGPIPQPAFQNTDSGLPPVSSEPLHSPN